MSEITIDPKLVAALVAKRESLSSKRANLKMLLYGESGVGKTVAAMQIAQSVTPKDKTIEVLDHLEGWTSLLNHKGLTDRADRQQYEGLSQIEALGNAIKAKAPPFDKVGTVILDEFSAMTKSDLDVVLKTRAANDSSKDPSVPTQPDFYSNTERSRRAITGLLQANINVIAVAHQREDKLSNGRVVTRPAFMPAFSETFRQMMHIVAYLSAEEFINDEDGSQYFKRSFQVHPTTSINAKSRVGGMPVSVTSDVLIEAIVQWMQGKRDTVSIEISEIEIPEVNEEIVESEDSVEININ